MKQYKIDIRFWSRKNRDRSMRKKLFEINARKIEEGQKRQLIAGASRCDGCTTILNREAYSAICRKEFRPDLFNEEDPCTVTASDRFIMECKRRVQDEVINGVEQKVTKFFQTPVVIDEARTMSREVLTHRVQELRRIHGPEWILATDGSFDPQWTCWLGSLCVEPIWIVLAVLWCHRNRSRVGRLAR